MSDSLREQLLKAGLVTKKQAAQAERQQHDRQHRQAKSGKKGPPPAQSASVAQAQAAKAARDQALNREREAKAEARARHAQIKQLIEEHKLPRIESDEYFNFVVGRKIRRIPVDAALRARLLDGSLAIARCEGRFDLVPPEIAARIRERDPRAVVDLSAGASQSQPAEDDPYKDFVVPDDLTW